MIQARGIAARRTRWLGSKLKTNCHGLRMRATQVTSSLPQPADVIARECRRPIFLVAKLGRPDPAGRAMTIYLKKYAEPTWMARIRGP
jgi:hypothetical protein